MDTSEWDILRGLALGVKRHRYDTIISLVQRLVVLRALLIQDYNATMHFWWYPYLKTVMSQLNQLYKRFTITVLKTGRMLMKIRNTDNKRSRQGNESDCPFDENFNYTISELEVQKSHLCEASMTSINANQLYFIHLRKNSVCFESLKCLLSL